MREKIRVGLLINEFFGAWHTGYGGYGMLARNYIARYLPNNEFLLDVIIAPRSIPRRVKVDQVNLYKSPKNRLLSKIWFNAKKYDVFLSIELTNPSYEVLKNAPGNIPLLLWVQDPRPWYDWREINTAQFTREDCYWKTETYEYVHKLNLEGRVKFISQGECLKDRARDLYRLEDSLQIKTILNPVEIPDAILDENKKGIDDRSVTTLLSKKDQSIVFVGRLASVKRWWLFCEIAKQMPDYQFYVLGMPRSGDDFNSGLLEKYRGIKNLHFVGHVEGEKKEELIRRAKVLVNTSIHEAIPVSFLEALSFGTLLVSNQNPDDLTSRFGKWIGSLPGDGFERVPAFVEAIRELTEGGDRETLARQAIKYIFENHNREAIVEQLREELRGMVKNR